MIDQVADEARYALDTEFHGERSYFPKLALIQIGWREQVALVDPLAVDVGPLASLLDGPGLMVAHAGDQDLAILERACGTTPNRLFDTQLAAGFVGLGSPSLSRLCEQLLDVQITKGDRLTDWTRRPLNEGQRTYAASDVDHLVSLHDALDEQLADLGRVEWADAEMVARLARDRSPQLPERAWWKFKGARSLRGKTRRVAQSVGAWRERTAQRLDLPARFVLSELAMAGITQRAPRSVADLKSVRGLEVRSLRDGAADEILAAVSHGLEMDDGELQRPRRNPASDRRLQPAVTLLGAWLAERASELRLEASLLGTRADLNELVAEGTGRLAQGWRAEIVGEPIRALMEGEMCVVLADGGRRLTIEPRVPPNPETRPQR